MRLYRLIMGVLFPVLLARLYLHDTQQNRAQRLGRDGRTQTGRAIWLHAASNGELNSAKTLINRLSQRFPLLITCNNPTGRTLVESWGFPNVQVQLAPLDLPGVLRRFLDAKQPRALIVIENEIWPNRIDAVAHLGLPIIVLSARLSASSARNWARFPKLARHILGTISLFSAQDIESQKRFRELGLPEDRLAPILNLKTTLAPSQPDSDEMDRLRPLLPRNKTILAASTHPGEDKIILQGFATALTSDPDLRLILAPRHPKRRDEIAQLLSEMELRFAARSVVPAPAPNTQVFLADTLGEMELWYALAGTVLVGGSLVPKGGHTPFEPAAFSCDLLHGPHLNNFHDAYDLLQQNSASTMVTGPAEIAQAFLRPFPVREAKGALAQDVLLNTDTVQSFDNLLSDILDLCKDGSKRAKAGETPLSD